MALFRNTKEKTAEVADSTVSSPSRSSVQSSHDILLRPHITEKSYALSKNNVYTFAVAPHATKRMVIQAIAKVYNVTPVRVNITVKRSRVVRSTMRAKTSKQAGLKKAFVYLQEGDTISYI